MAPPPDISVKLEPLLARCANGDARALEAVYRLTAPALLGCLAKILRRRALAEEVLQDVYVQVWQRAANFDAHRGRAWPWLLSVARYRAIDILRRERADAVDPQVLAETLAVEPVDEVADPTALGSGAVLERCLGGLPAEQRQSIQLAFLGGRSHPEVATSLQRPLGSVKSWIRRGLVALKECIEACDAQATN